MQEHGDLTIGQLIEIVQQADVLKIMGENHLNALTVDYMPATQALIRVRSTGDGFEPIRRVFETQALTFRLDSAQMGGVTYASLVLGDRVVIEPWRWESFEHLAEKRAVMLDSQGRRRR